MSEPTDEEGRFRVGLLELPSHRTNREGYLTGLLAYVRRGDEWGGDYETHPSGFAEKHDLLVEFERNPVFRLVGRSKAPLIGARVALHHRPEPHRAVLRAPVSTAVADAGGLASPEWPPWLETVFLTVDVPSGDRIQMVVHKVDVVLYDPYELELDPGHVPFVRLRAPAGMSVHVHGLWVPRGYEPTEVNLIGRVPESGEIEWRFFGLEPEVGFLQPGGWSCEYVRDGLPRIARSEAYRDKVLSGGFLPPIELPATYPKHRMLFAFTPDRDGSPWIWGSGFRKGELVANYSLSLDGSVELPDGRRAWHSIAWVDEELDSALFSFVLPGRRIAAVELGREELFAAAGGNRVVEVRLTGELSPARMLVERADGTPVPHARVTAVVVGGRWPISAQTVAGPDGYAEMLLDPAAGRWRVIVVDPATGKAGVVPEWEATGHVRRIQLGKPVRVRFQVLYPDRTPAPHSRMTLSSYEYAHVKRLTLYADAQGRVVTPPLLPALYRAAIKGPKPGVLSIDLRRIGRTVVLGNP